MTAALRRPRLPIGLSRPGRPAARCPDLVPAGDDLGANAWLAHSDPLAEPGLIVEYCPEDDDEPGDHAHGQNR
jgi:hypothetical protein